MGGVAQYAAGGHDAAMMTLRSDDARRAGERSAAAGTDQAIESTLEILNLRGVFHPHLARRVSGCCTSERKNDNGQTISPRGLTYLPRSIPL